MRHRSTRKSFQHAAPRRPYRVLMGSAALIAAAAVTGALLNQTQAPANAHGAAIAVLETAAIANDQVATSTTPAAPAPTNTAANVPAEKVVKYEFQFQPNFYYCGPASTRIALTSHGVALSQNELARKLGTTVNGTNSANETTRVLNGVLGKDVYQTRWIPGQRATAAEAERLQQDVVRAISSERAIVANIVGRAKDAVGVWHEFPGGHFITIVGYRDSGRSIQIADPSGMYGPRTYWMTTSTMANWMAARGYSA